MPRPAFNPKHLVMLAVPEGLIVMVVIVRGTVLGEADLSRPLHLAWLVGTIVLAASAISLFVLRSIAASRAAGDDAVAAEESVGLLGPSLGVLGLAGLLALAGPAVLERLLG